METQYCACCVDDEEVYFYGLGASPDQAFSEFLESGQFKNQCDDFLAEKGEGIEVYIYTTCPEEECDPGWEFVLDEKIETRIAKAI